MPEKKSWSNAETSSEREHQTLQVDVSKSVRPAPTLNLSELVFMNSVNPGHFRHSDEFRCCFHSWRSPVCGCYLILIILICTFCILTIGKAAILLSTLLSDSQQPLQLQDKWISSAPANKARHWSTSPQWRLRKIMYFTSWTKKTPHIWTCVFSIP